MATLATNFNTKTCSEFSCEKCNYITNKKSSFDIHVLSIKHNSTTPLLPTCKKYCCFIIIDEINSDKRQKKIMVIAFFNQKLHLI